MSNLSKLKREQMLDFLAKLRDSKKDDEDALVAINEIENEINEKKYGLVWEEHSEEVDEMMVDNVPILIEDKSREITKAGNDSYNFLIEGDNLHSLKLLNKTHHEKIDVIYIDPPYNTGNGDFIYDDKIVGSDDGYKHSKWLSFMEKRLSVAKELLSNQGVIYISIDDNESSQLKMLCDSVFGEQNFINLITVKTKTSSGASGGGEDKRLKKNNEYLLIYAKERYNAKINKPLERNKISDYILEHKENGVGFYYTRILEDFGQKELVAERDGLKIYKHSGYSFSTVSEKMKNENLTLDEVYAKYFDRIFMVTNAQTSLLAKVNNSFPDSGQLLSYDYIPTSGKFKGTEISKYVWNKTLVVWLKDSATLEDNFVYKNNQLGTLWSDISYGRLDLQGDVKFKNGKKPVDLVKRVISMSSNKDSIILDFFAGSATTGEAVLEANKDDGGNRRFIVCTNNENNICTNVAYPRLSTVISGKRKGGSTYSDGIAANLKYYKTEFVAKDSETLVDDLIAHTDEMIQLEYGIQIDKDKYISILTDEEADELFKDWNKYPNIKAIYVSRHVVLNAEQRKLFYTKDVYIIPDYYYRQELREVGE